jgi:hypothetical protein
MTACHGAGPAALAAEEAGKFSPEISVECLSVYLFLIFMSLSLSLSLRYGAAPKIKWAAYGYGYERAYFTYKGLCM